MILLVFPGRFLYVKAKYGEFFKLNLNYKNPIEDPYEKEQENYYSNLRLNLNVINKLMLNQGGVSSDGGNQTEEEMEVLGKY